MGGRGAPPDRGAPPRDARGPDRDGDHIYTGAIVRIHDRGYGFIKDNDRKDRDWFFPAKEVRGTEITELNVGDKVMFKLGRDHRSQKWEAQDVRLHKEEWCVGTIARLKDNFGFIEIASGEPTIYFHGRHIQNAQFSELQVGTRVNFLAVPSRSRPGTREGQQITLGDEEEAENEAQNEEEEQ